MSSADIRKAVFGLVVDRNRLTRSEVETKYAELMNAHKPLYEYALDPTMDVQQMIRVLDTMLEAREKINSGAMEKLAAEMYVGNRLGNEFIYDKVEKPSGEDYKRAVKKINELSKNGGDVASAFSKSVESS